MSEGWGRGGKGKWEGLFCVFLLGGGGDLLWCTMFSFERGSSALKKKSFYPHISHQFSLPSVARLCGLTQQGSTGYFLVNNTNQL